MIWRRPKPNGSEGEQEYFSCFSAHELTDKRRYRIHWLYSSNKRQNDRNERTERLVKAEQALGALNAKLNHRLLRTPEQIEKAANEILLRYRVGDFLSIAVRQTEQVYTRQTGPGRPGKNTRYSTVREMIYTLTWVRQKHPLQQEAKCDGVFPLLSTDDQLSAKEVLQAYKYQPKLEKRFMQFKSIHQAAPLLFKKVERVEANLFAFFVALMIQALLEREVRNAMVASGIKNLKLYPEQRPAVHPTTSKVLTAFEDLSAYQICARSRVVEQYQDQLNDTQKAILKLLRIPQRQYWEYNERRKI